MDVRRCARPAASLGMATRPTLPRHVDPGLISAAAPLPALASRLYGDLLPTAPRSELPVAHSALALCSRLVDCCWPLPSALLRLLPALLLPSSSSSSSILAMVILYAASLW